MDKTFLFVPYVSLALFFPDAKAQSADHSSMDIEALQCEYLDNPVGVDVSCPRFTWQLTDSLQRRGQRQTAYELLVASNEDILAEDKGDVWNSGKVESDQSTLVDYGGTALVSNKHYYWKVRVYDMAGKPSAWSRTGHFITALLSPKEWKAAWIRHPGEAKENHIWFRKSFRLENDATTALIHVTSMGYHELYVNGKKADDRILAPALSRLDKRVLYVTYDIAPLLSKGENTIALWTGPGWARYEYFNKAVSPALKAQLHIEDATGGAQLVCTDNSWKCTISASKNLGACKYRDNGGEYIDARKYLDNWNVTGFNDSQWQIPLETDFRVTLSAQAMEATRIIDTLGVHSIALAGKDSYRVDMGRNFTGWVKVDMRGTQAGDSIVIRVADDETTTQDFAQRCIYVSSGRDQETFCNRFNYVAGRYITISGLRQKPEAADVTGYAIGTDLRRSGSFNCSDTLFNQIYDTDLRTFRACTIEGYTCDCPHRERLGYGEEVFATAWGIGLPNYQVGAFYQKHVRDWTDVQERNGWIHHTAPQINEHFGGPMWSSAGLNLSWELYVNYGDTRILQTIYPSAQNWLEFLHRNSQWGLLENYSKDGKFLGDWAAPGGRKEFGGTPEATYFNNCVYAYNLLTMVRLAKALGKDDDATLYERRLKQLKRRIQRQFWDEGEHCYMDGNQVQTAFPLWLDITPDSLRNQQQQVLHDDLTRQHPYLDMGSSGLPVLMKYLTEKNPAHHDAVAAALRRTTEPSYAYFLSRGETTWPEYWSSDVPSRIHTCFTGIAAWFTKSVAGISPMENYPGYKKFLVRPTFIEGLSFANATTSSLYGTIQCDWQRDGKQTTLNVTVPVNTEALLHIPATRKQTIEESNYPLNESQGLEVVQRTDDELVVSLKAGNYKFLITQS